MEFPEERILIQRLWEQFHKDYISTGEVAQFDGCSLQTVRRRYGIKKGINITSLAHLKCKLARGKTSCRY